MAVPLLSGCANIPVKQAGETDVQCIHRLYDYPTRALPFQTAASECAAGRPPDLTGDRIFQVQASSLNMAFVNHDPNGGKGIVLTGSRLTQPTSEPAPPQLQIR